jgi:hypothetical protein
MPEVSSSSWRKSKYHNEPTFYNGIRFHSKKEARHAWELDLAKKSGDLEEYFRQVPFELPGGVKYFLDFKEYWKGGEVRYVDVKGYSKEAVYRMKKKMVEAIYKIKIMEV